MSISAYYSIDEDRVLGEERDGSSREETIQSLLYLVQHIAGRVISRLPSHITKDDLISAGVIGLIDAVDRFDKSKGCSLKTYSSMRIKGAIMDELRSLDWVPRSVHRDERTYNEACDRVSQREGREATDEEVRAELKMDPESFQQLCERAHPYSNISLNEAWCDEEGNSTDRSECIANPNAKTAVEELLDQEDFQMVREQIERLPKNEKIVLCLYYMEDLRLKEIAEVLRVTESRVSQIHSEALKHLSAGIRKVRNR